MPIGPHTAIPLSEILVRASRSSGPGGQHANVTASRIEAVLDLQTCEELGEAERARLIARLGPRVVAVAQDTRSQARNRELALVRLQERLRSALAVAPKRTRTRPTRASVKRRLETKRRNADRKQGRRPPGDDGN